MIVPQAQCQLECKQSNSASKRLTLLDNTAAEEALCANVADLFFITTNIKLQHQHDRCVYGNEEMM